MAVVREMVAHLRAENARLRAELRAYQEVEDEPSHVLFRLIAENPPMAGMRNLLMRVARRLFGSRPPSYAWRREVPPAGKRLVRQPYR